MSIEYRCGTNDFTGRELPYIKGQRGNLPSVITQATNRQWGLLFSRPGFVRHWYMQRATYSSLKGGHTCTCSGQARKARKLM